MVRCTYWFILLTKRHKFNKHDWFFSTMNIEVAKGSLGKKSKSFFFFFISQPTLIQFLHCVLESFPKLPHESFNDRCKCMLCGNSTLWDSTECEKINVHFSPLLSVHQWTKRGLAFLVGSLAHCQCQAWCTRGLSHHRAYTCTRCWG